MGPWPYCSGALHSMSFDMFFASARAETESPFLTPVGRRWGRHLPLRTGLVAAVLWIACMTIVLVAGWHPSAAVLCAGVYFLVGTGAAIDLIEQLRQRRLEID